jgi:hypothetical protein
VSIAVLHQVYDETRRLVIAGSAVAPGDFRLKKLIPALEQAGTKSPVFAKLAQSATALIASDEKSSPLALLELGTLITAILYTQSETGIEGELKPIDAIDFGLSKTQTPAKLLKPLLDALTTKGSGRLEIIRTSHEQGLFQDLRLIRPAVLALDDSYSEIADFVAERVLPLYGSALVPELEAQFNAKGKAGQPRRLLLMHRLDPARAQPYVRAAIEEGNAEMRVAAIECLGSSVEDLPFLLEQLKSKAKNVRHAALKSLARMKLKEADELLIAQIDSDELPNACEALRTTESQAVVAVLIDRIRDQLSASLSGKPKSKAKGSLDKQLERLQQLLYCMEGRTDVATESLHTDLLKSVDLLRVIKGSPSGEDIVNTLASNLARGSAKMKELLCQEHKAFGKEVFSKVFCAACEVWKPDAVFKEFSPYVLDYLQSNKKKMDLDAQKGEVICGILSANGYYHYDYADFSQMDVTGLSKKWLELAIERGISGILTRLAVLDKKKAQPALSSLFDSLIKSKTSSPEFGDLSRVIAAMIQVEHPASVDSMLEIIKKLSDSPTYHSQWILRHIASLPPQETLPKLEALLPSLADKVANEVIDSMYTLKQMT